MQKPTYKKDKQNFKTDNIEIPTFNNKHITT